MDGEETRARLIKKSMILFGDDTVGLEVRDPKTTVDAFGDALPPRARLRLGTTRIPARRRGVLSGLHPDGNTLVSCGWGTRDVRLWEVATARELPPCTARERRGVRRDQP